MSAVIFLFLAFLELSAPRLKFVQSEVSCVVSIPLRRLPINICAGDGLERATQSVVGVCKYIDSSCEPIRGAVLPI